MAPPSGGNVAKIECRNILGAAGGLLSTILAFAQGSLPACEGSSPTRWTDCIGTVTFRSGIRYFGDWRDGKPHGRGTATLPSGRTYVGEWRDGEKNGQGTETSPDGAKYVGEYKNDKV